MATSIPGFDADGFRAGIRMAMEMAMPDDDDRRPTFVTLVPAGAPPAADADGVPWVLSDSMAAPESVSIKALCAIEQFERSVETRHFGPLRPGEIEVTLLDEEYASIEGFDHLLLFPTLTGDPVVYHYRRVLLQTNLDSVGIWVLECATEDMV